MKLKMLLFTTSILLLAVNTSSAIVSSSKERMANDKEYSFIQQYKVTSPLELSVSTTGGNINTVGWADNTVEVSFIVTQKGEILDITFEQLKDYADVEIINENSKLEINVKKNILKNVSIGFSIKTPANTSAKLNTSGGNISVSGISGKQAVNTSGGNVSLDKITGNVMARTSGGNISISNSKADFDASTSGGNISLDNINGKLSVSTSGGNINADNITNGLSASTSGGNINLENVQGPVDVSTSGGGIHLDDISGSVKAITSGGDIKANITKLTDKLELETSGGSINATIPSGLGLDLDLSADNIKTSLANFKGTSKKDRVKGQLNGGGISVHLSSSGGNISLDYK